MNLRPIKPKRIADQVFEQLREKILRGEIKPGDQLLPERELAESLAVSRTTVRNALSKLITLNFLEQRQGQGTFVSSPESGKGNPLASIIDVEDASINDILEIRLGLECNAAALAAKRATDQDIISLSRTVQDMEEIVKDGDLGYGEDAAFHMAIAYATKNMVQIQMMRNFYDLLFFGIKKNLKHLHQEPINIDNILKQHRQVYNAIVEHDPVKAEAAMREHIVFVQDWFRNR